MSDAEKTYDYVIVGAGVAAASAVKGIRAEDASGTIGVLGSEPDKPVYRHSGYPGGLKQIAYGDLLEKDAAKAIEKSVRGMLPKNRLGNQIIRKLKVYAGPDHPHAAQKPQPFEITQISQ